MVGFITERDLQQAEAVDVAEQAIGDAEDLSQVRAVDEAFAGESFRAIYPALERVAPFFVGCDVKEHGAGYHRAPIGGRRTGAASEGRGARSSRYSNYSAAVSDYSAATTVAAAAVRGRSNRRPSRPSRRPSRASS